MITLVAKCIALIAIGTPSPSAASINLERMIRPASKVQTADQLAPGSRERSAHNSNRLEAPTMNDPMPKYSAMLREALGERLRPASRSFVEMLDERGVVEFPFAPPSLPPRVEGRAALQAHLQRAAGMIEFAIFRDIKPYETSDAEVVVIEFSGSGRSVASGAPYEQRYISFVTIRDGRIILFREYSNPLAVLSTSRGKEFVDSLFPKN